MFLQHLFSDCMENPSFQRKGITEEGGRCISTHLPRSWIELFSQKRIPQIGFRAVWKEGTGLHSHFKYFKTNLNTITSINGAFLAFHCLYCLSFSIVHWLMYTACMFNRFLQSSSCKLNELLKEMLSWRLTYFPIIVLFSSFPSPFCKISI